MAGAALREPPCAEVVAGAALCEPPCADFVAGTALCEPPCVDFVAGTAYNEVQVAQVCYNEVWFIGCPSSLGSSSSATTRAHTFRLSRLFHFHLSLLRAHVPCLLSGQDGGHTCLPSGRRVCVTFQITGNPRVWSRGPGQIHRRLVNEAGDVSEDMEMGRHFHVPAPLFRKTGGNGTRHTCVSVPFLLLSSTLPCGFAGRPPNFVMGIFNPNFGLHPLELAPNLCCLVCLVFLVLLVTNLLALAPNLLSTASNLRAKTPHFDGFAVLVLVTNLLAMAP